VSHPSLGLPPSDPTAGLPEAAARIRTNEPRLAARALRVAMDADASIERRFDETGLRYLLRDAELLAERVAVSVETDRPDLAREYAEWTAPVYRRRGVSMDDVVALCEGLREAFPSVLAPGELPAANAALDAAIKAYRWHRRIAGDARHKNAFLQFLYKGG
jgi:D-alanine-D-alanine ligase-like ATP-grasp enzyme